LEEKDCVYDWETNGLNKGWKYPHEIAIADLDDEESLKRYDIKIPDYELPGPMAFYNTNTSWKKAREGETLYNILPNILSDMYDYDVIWAWNHSYDLDVLEQSLFNNGLNPWSYRNEGRVFCDALPFISLASVIYPDIIKIPTKERIKKDKKEIVFSHVLENVYKESFPNDTSLIWHQADSDVKATVRLLNVIKENCPDFWNLRTRMFSEFARQDIFSKEAVWIRYRYNEKEINPMLPVYQRDKKTWFSIDLLKYHNEGGLLEKNRNQIKKVGKGETKTLPNWLHGKAYTTMKQIVLDASWFDLPINFSLPPKNEIDEIKLLIEDNLSNLTIWPEKDEEYLEQQMFGFPSYKDKDAWVNFHKAETWDKKVQTKFKDKRSKRIAQRIIFDNAPEVLDDLAYGNIINEIKKRWISIGPKQRPYGKHISGESWVTIPTALENIRQCEQEDHLEKNSHKDIGKSLGGYKEFLLKLYDDLK